jgi:flagellar assembly protein FliH
MTQAQVVLRQLALEGSAALPARAPVVADPSSAMTAFVLQAARDEGLRQGREQGLRAGHEEGLRQGRDAAQAEAVATAAEAEVQAAAQRNQRQAQLASALAALQVAAEQWLTLAEEDLVALCYETVARVLGRAAVAPDSVRAQVLQLLAQWRGRGMPVLHLHPADAQLLEGLPSDRAFTCVADPEVGYGGCLVCGEAGALDARLDRILEEVKAALLAARNERAGAR